LGAGFFFCSATRSWLGLGLGLGLGRVRVRVRVRVNPNLRLGQALLVVEADRLDDHEVVPVDGEHRGALGVLHRPLVARRAVALAHEARVLLDASERAQPVVALLVRVRGRVRVRVMVRVRVRVRVSSP